MTAPVVRQRPPHEPLRGGAWLAARLTLALRRTRRFTRWWLAIGGTVTVVALLLPVAAGDSDAALRAAVERAAADTLRASATRRRWAAARDEADSTLRALRSDVTRAASRPARVRDPRLLSLDAALAEARTRRDEAALLALADDPAVRFGPRMQATADSLRLAPDDAERQRLGNVILAIGQFRRNAIAEQAAENETPEPEPFARGDTVAAAARLAAAGDSLAAAQRRYELALDAHGRTQEAVQSGRAPLPPVSPGLALLAALLAGLGLRVGASLSRELKAPTLAHATEAERSVGAPALAIVKDPLPAGPLRFRPSGVDPFRVLYLGLTATGTRTRALIVTGDDAVIVAAVGARLAIAAAADHRTTLIAELDPRQIALARLFRDHAEPGFTDALAGAFAWREVARSVGSSDGLSIAMIPAGTERDAVLSERREAAIAAFGRFREQFEFTIVTGVLPDLPEARALLPGAPVVLCGTVGETEVERFTRMGAEAESSGERIHSVALWDAPRPELPSRAELAAQLSKRRGRTPGGSFKAVQEAIKKPL